MEMRLTATGLFLTTSAEVEELHKRTYRDISKVINGEMRGMRDKIRGELFPWKSRGRQYPSRRSGSRKLHTASRPNFPPNQDTGTLRKSIRLVGSLEGGDLTLEALVLPPMVNYAEFLETGTARMRPRPFFFKTIERVIKSRRFKYRLKQVFAAIRNDLEGKRGLMRSKDNWVVVK